MVQGADYRIKKIEKGPLQRFKHQNLLIKKFGEIGLQIYKAITGKRSTHELRQDLGIEEDLFNKVVNYMKDAGMIELEPVTSAPSEKPSAIGEPEEPQAVAMQRIHSEDEPTLEELPEDEEPADESPPMEEEPVEGIEPLDMEPLEPEGVEVPEEESEPEESPEEEPAPQEPSTEEPEEIQDIEPFGFEDITPVDEDEDTVEAPEPEPPPDDDYPEDSSDEIEIDDNEDISVDSVEPEPYDDESSDMSPVEKIINDKYGDLGLRVYALIDGQRTAEEIMQETGLTESKLVEILDFMDEQGIIKLDYPKGGGAPSGGAPMGPSSPQGGPTFAQHMGGAAPMPPPQPQGGGMGFNPMIEGDERLDEARAGSSPVEMPIRAPLDIVKSVQMKAKIMLKYGDKGNKVIELVDGKNDVIDISLILERPLFEIAKMLGFLMQNGMIIMKPLSRTDIRKKYGDDGYSVYKKYGKEGLMLYELIGKEMTIKQMADMITEDKAKIIDMFIFIHQVLGIELPIDKDVLSKQLGI